jgi:hypothetical protein
MTALLVGAGFTQALPGVGSQAARAEKEVTRDLAGLQRRG